MPTVSAKAFAALTLAALCGATAVRAQDSDIPTRVQEVRGFAMVDGVNTRTGNFSVTYADFADQGVPYRRTYNSNVDNAGTFGRAWGSSFDTRAIGMPDGRVAVLENGNGALTVYGQGPPGESQIVMERRVAAAAKAPSDAPREVIGAKLKIENDFALQDAAGCDDATLATMATGYIRHTCAGRFETFDTQGRLTGFKLDALTAFGQGSISSPLEVSIARDAEGRIATVTDNHGHRLTFTRKANTLEVKNEAGAWVTFTFDAAGRMTASRPSNTASYTFGYDGDGMMTRIGFIDGTARKIAYAMGRVSELTARDGETTRFEYLPAIKVTQITRTPAKGAPSRLLIQHKD